MPTPRHPKSPLAIGLVLSLAAAAPLRADPPQTLSFLNYCEMGTLDLCSSIVVNLVPSGGSTALTISLQNLQGTLGSQAWAMYDINLGNLHTNLVPGTGGIALPNADLVGTAGYLSTVNPATCAIFAECPNGPGNGEWDWGSGLSSLPPQRGLIQSTSDPSPNPYAIVGCNAPPQSGPAFEWGYLQTCGDGWVNFTFNLPGTWTFDDSSYVSRGAWDQNGNYTRCTMGQDCTQVTPEPETIVLLATGLSGIGAFSFRRRRRRTTA